MEGTYKEGDVVQAVFGGPEMIVVYVNTPSSDHPGEPTKVKCIWFDDVKAIHSWEFHAEFLRPITSKKNVLLP